MGSLWRSGVHAEFTAESDLPADAGQSKRVQLFHSHSLLRTAATFAFAIVTEIYK